MNDKGEFLIHTTDESAEFKLLGEIKEHTIKGSPGESSITPGAEDAQIGGDVTRELLQCSWWYIFNLFNIDDLSQTLSTGANKVSRVSAHI